MTDPLPPHAYDRLAKAARAAEPPSTDLAVALVALAKGTLRQEDLESARLEQRLRKEEGLEPEPLGQILLRRGFLTRAQYHEFLSLRPAPEREVPEMAQGSPFGRFEIVGKLGRGGSGIVYRARDPHLGRDVALKVLRFSGDPSMRERLEREARTTARLAHPNIVTLHEAGTLDGTSYLVMELIPGESLAVRMPSLALEDKLALLGKVARAVAYAHSQGVIHRDLKPGNILIRPGGEPVVMDFGLARSLEGDLDLTVTGAAVGTPLYMAPEQLLGRREAVGPRTDIYALGVILYEALAGRPPFQGETIAQVTTRILSEDPVPPERRRPGVPRELSAAALRALEKDPARRYATAWTFAEDLARFGRGEPLSAKPLTLAGKVWRKLMRHRAIAAVSALSVAALASAGGYFLPKLVQARREVDRERRVAQERETALRELGALSLKVVLARKDFYQFQTDAARTREKLKESLAALDAFVARHPQSPQGYYVRARARLALDDLSGAGRDLGRAVGMEPAFGPAWALLGRTLLEQVFLRIYSGEGRAAALLIEEAERALRQALACPAEHHSPKEWGLIALEEDEADSVLTQALIAKYVRGDAELAKRTLLSARRKSPSEDHFLWLAVWADAPEERARLAGEALALMPHFARAHLERGNANFQLGNVRAAWEDYRKSLAVNPDLGLAWLNRAVTRREAGDVAGALSDARRAALLDPEDGPSHSFLGILLCDTGDWEGALASLSRAIELDPDDAAPRAYRGLAHFRKGNTETALRDCDVAVELDPRYAPGYLHRGIVRGGNGDPTGAIEDFSRALTLQPDLAPAYLERAKVREKTGDVPGAQADREKARELTPRSP